MFRKGIALIVILLFVGVSIIPQTASNEEIKEIYVNLLYAPHDPIYINGNDNFTSENGVTGGSGTPANPFKIEGWDICASSQDGIVIRNVSVYFVIRECYIHEGGYNNDGIVFIYVKHGAINNTIISGNRNSIMFRRQDFVDKENSCYNIIHNNTIKENSDDGIHFEHTIGGHHSYNLIYLNNISGNNQGIYMVMSAYNHIYSNNIISNGEAGVNISICMGGGGSNSVFHNNFINNGDENGQAREWFNTFCFNNYWDDGYPSGGNFWSDYTGVDNFSGPNQNISGSDGLGDTPYEIPCYYCEGCENSTDKYPLMKPYGNVSFTPITTISLDPPYPDGNNGYYISNVTVTLTAWDDDEVSKIYYRVAGGEWTNHSGSVISFILDYDCLSNGLIEYYSVDSFGNQEEIKSVSIDMDQLPPEVEVEVETYKESGKWIVKFNVIGEDACSGTDRVEMFINDGFHEEVIGSGPTYEFTIEWHKAFKSVTFWFYCYDVAGNVASVSVNGSDIKSYSYSQSYRTLFLRWLERFPILQKILDVLRLNIR